MFSVIRGGCFSRHPSDFVMNRPSGLPYYVLLLIKSDSVLRLGDETGTCKPNSFLIIKPNTPYSYQNPNGDYIDDWLHFTCLPEDLTPYDASLFHHNAFVNNVPLLTSYIQQILWETQFSTSQTKDYCVDALFKILLNHIYEDITQRNVEEYNPYRFTLQKLRLEIQSCPSKKYAAPEIASKLELSTSYFQALYKKVFGIAFQTDVINMRIEYAKELISTTNLPLDQIAYSCGYSGEVHFYRQFLTKIGMTPGEYRKTFLPK